MASNRLLRASVILALSVGAASAAPGCGSSADTPAATSVATSSSVAASGASSGAGGSGGHGGGQGAGAGGGGGASPQPCGDKIAPPWSHHYGNLNDQEGSGVTVDADGAI